MTAKLLTPLKIRNVELQNRVMMSSMCQYSAYDGLPNEWHYVHYGSRAVGKVGLIMVEATAISPEGRITPWDLGIWSDEHIIKFEEIVNFIDRQGSVAGIQLAHAGRKASTARPWEGQYVITETEGGWQTIAPSPLPFAPGNPIPHEMSIEEIQEIIKKFEVCTRRSAAAGFKVIEIHAAHGYLLHEFLSPLSNKRQDEYGGSLENRQRLLLEIARKVRDVWPNYQPVFVRMSATDWIPEGWDINDTIDTAKKLQEIGIDVIDVSSGGNLPDITIDEEPGFQVSFSEAIKEEIDIKTVAVGLITEPEQANNIIENEKADIVALGRELLRNPYWVLHASSKLHIDLPWPKQYLRAKK